MVSKPNFVLGIKQTSLASKEDSHVHTTIRSHTCLSAGSRLHGILQPPWLTTVSRSSSPSNACLSLSNLCTSSLHLIKPTRQKCSTAYREQNPGTRPPTTATHTTTREQQLLELSHAAEGSRLPASIIATHAAMSASLLGDLQNPRGPAIYRVHTRQNALPTFPDPSHALPRFPIV